MSAIANCPSCGVAVHLPAELVGREVRCGRCQAVFRTGPVARLGVHGAEEWGHPSPGAHWSLQRARQKVVAPAVFLQVCGWVVCLSVIACVLFAVISLAEQNKDSVVMAVIFGVLALCCLITGPIIVLGGMRMKALRSYGLAITAVVLLSFIGLMLCMPFALVGLWPLIILLDQDVKAGFSGQPETL